MNSTPDDPDEPGAPAEQPAAAPSDEPATTTPYGPADPVAPPPYVPPTAEQAAPEQTVPLPPPYQPGVPTAPPPGAVPSPFPPGDATAEAPRTPLGVGAGIGIGCGLQFVAGLIFLFTAFAAGSLWGPLVPAILITVAAIVGMFFARWRRLSTGVLIISAATWLIFLGPCIALLGGFR